MSRRGWFWKLWFLSGVSDEYIDIDYNFWLVRGHIHIKYGSGEVCSRHR